MRCCRPWPAFCFIGTRATNGPEGDPALRRLSVGGGPNCRVLLVVRSGVRESDISEGIANFARDAAPFHGTAHSFLRDFKAVRAERRVA